MRADSRGQPGDGFQAARFERALGLLSDPAFKVYAWACLHAERASGRLQFERTGLARQLGKSPSSLGRHLRELVRAGVCELDSAANQHRGSLLLVRPEYWPYERAAKPPPDSPVPAAGEYVRAVREAFLARACVQAGFGPDDERLALDWEADGVDVDTVRRAILLGSTRKSLSLLGREGSQPIRSLKYFEPLLQEVRAERFPAEYWRHLQRRLDRCEQDLGTGTASVPQRPLPGDGS